MLIHCFGCSLHWWDSMVPLLSRDHRVVRIDLLGHGGSAKPKSGYSITDQGALVAGALDRLGVQGAVIVGHSLGGDVAVSVAEQASELVDRLVLIDEAPDPSFGDLDFLAKVSMAPVIGEALWRLKTDSLVKAGYDQAFAPGYDQADGFEDPDQTARDNDAMTFTSYTESPQASEDYENESPLDDRMRTTAVPLMVDLRGRGPDLRRRRVARRLRGRARRADGEGQGRRALAQRREARADRAPDQRVRRRRGR